MIKFFKKIRQRLLTENRFTKYLIYALGEIFLVVVGILIALQVNNWNENKKLKKEEHKLIQSLIKEIEANSEELADVIAYNDSLVKKSTDFLDKALTESELEINPFKLPPLFRYYAKIFKHTILDNVLEGENRVNLSDDDVLKQLNDLKFNYERYELTLKYTDDYWNTKVLDLFNSTGLGIYLVYDESISYKEVDFKLDKEFLSALSIMSMFQETLLLSRRDLSDALQQTLSHLENYKSKIE